MGARWAMVSSLFVLLSSAAVEAQACELTGALTLERLRVQPRGGAPFELDLEGHPASLQVRGGRYWVTSRSGLSFEGTAPVADVPIDLNRALEVRGALTVRPGAPLSRARFAGGGLRARVTLAAGIHADIPLPCDAVELGRSRAASHVPYDAPSTGGRLARRGSLRVHATIGGPPVVLRIATAGARFAELERRPDWVRVRRDFADSGVTVTGWVAAADLRAAPAGPLEPMSLPMTMSSGGGCGQSASHTYVGPATLRGGSDVFDDRAGHAWAHAPADHEVVVYWRWGDEWARIQSADGLRSRDTDCPILLERAWVPRSALRIRRPGP